MAKDQSGRAESGAAGGTIEKYDTLLRALEDVASELHLLHREPAAGDMIRQLREDLDRATERGGPALTLAVIRGIARLLEVELVIEQQRYNHLATENQLREAIELLRQDSPRSIAAREVWERRKKGGE